MTKIVSLERLSLFWSKVKSYFNPKIEKVDRKLWKGTQAELPIAIAAGLVDESTLVVLTDAGDETPWSFATSADIRALFPQYL